ncbi:ATP-binding protein [Aliikangiella sp. IMCC44359]|uniref:ATP-binding protein n=1 Tax=Aliikangiella sp. IMCC44359 TaxID=3459125 RepID=UPI00403B174D
MKKMNFGKPQLKLNLFWKIFAWFWLTMVILITTYLFTGYINSGKTYFRPLPHPVNHELKKITKRINFLISTPSKRSRLLKKRLRDTYLLSKEGSDYFGKDTPELLINLHDRVKRQSQPLSVFQNKIAFFGGTLINVKGESYWVYSKQKQPSYYRYLIKNFFKDTAKILFFSTFIISFPVSFLLSWIVTRPIRRLQQATREMKSDLSNRDNLYQLFKRSDEFGELARDFNKLANHLESTLSSQKQLLSDVSHELRSPLARLKIALGMMDNPSSEVRQTNLKRIQLESDRMNEMLDNLLTLSKLEAQEIGVSKEEFNLCQLVESVVDDARFEAEQSDIEIQLMLPSSCLFSGLRESLISGIENILRNAIKYAGPSTCIKVQLVQSAQEVILTIEDNGPGVSPPQLNKLFDAFYRPDFDRARNKGGVGLGLSIAKRAFAINGGSISAENIQPHGLKITITFKP